MGKKIYKFNYDYHKAELTIEVDTEKFTPELAKETLGFFRWNYDKEADPIDEVLKKYALQILMTARSNRSVKGVIYDWDQEGFGPIDGSIGLLLTEYSEFEFEENDLEMEVSNE